MKPPVVVIVGPTASGKSDLALAAAHVIGGEVVSADSMQLYKGMDIGTAKLAEEEREGIPHHMLDITDPGSDYSVADYQRDAHAAVEDILARGKVPILAGGSGLHVNSITHDLRFADTKGESPSLREELRQMDPDELYALLEREDPQAAARIHPNNTVRVIRALEIARQSGAPRDYSFERPSVRYDFICIGISPAREALRTRIDARVDAMLAAGLLEEARGLFFRYPDSQVLRRAIGYKELLPVIEGGQSLENVADAIKIATRHLAKRQMTWFRRDARIRWFDDPHAPRVLSCIVESVLR